MGLLFRTKDNGTSTNGLHDVNALWLSPKGKVGIGLVDPNVNSMLTVKGSAYDS